MQNIPTANDGFVQGYSRRIIFTKMFQSLIVQFCFIYGKEFPYPFFVFIVQQTEVMQTWEVIDIKSIASIITRYRM